MALGLGAWALWVLWSNFPLLRYLAVTPGAWDASCLGPFLTGTAWPALAAAALLVLAAGAGRRLCRILAFNTDGPLAALPGALGLGLLGTAFFVAGLSGKLRLGMGLALSLIILASIPEIPSLIKTLSTRRGVQKYPHWKLGLGVVLGATAFHAVILALAPTTGWDALAYHLALPRLYLNGDSISEWPWLLHSHWPHLMEVLYALPLALGLESAAALIHAAACTTLVFTVFRLGRETGSSAAGWAAAALLACQPVLLDIAGEPHSDGALTLFHLLSCVLLWRWSQKNETGLPAPGLLVAAGLCSGLAAACKLQGLALGGALGLWLLWSPRRRRGAWSFALWAALPALPWFLRTWLATGNPVWPFFSGLLGGHWEPRHIEEALARACRWNFPNDQALLWSYGPQYLLLPGACLAALAFRKGLDLPPFLRFLFVPALPMLVLSMPYHEAWRYLLPLTPALALACGWWCEQACSVRNWRRPAAYALMLFGLAPVLGLSQSNELFAVLAARSQFSPGVDAREVYRTRSLPFYGFYKKVEALMTERDKVLLFREVRGYHLKASYQWGDPVIQSQIIYSELSMPQDLWRKLASQGLTHVLVNTGNGIYGLNEKYYDARTLTLMEITLRRHARLLLREGPLALYAVNAGQ